MKRKHIMTSLVVQIRSEKVPELARREEIGIKAGEALTGIGGCLSCRE